MQSSYNNKMEANSQNQVFSSHVSQSIDNRKQYPQSAAWGYQKQALPSGPGCPQILYAYSPPNSNIYENYKGTQSVWNGSLQILTGLACIAFNSGAIQVGIDVRLHLAEIVGYGIWGGAFFLVSGSLGIAAGKLKTKCLIVSFMVWCILSCCVTAVILSLSIINILIGSGEGYAIIAALNGVLIALSVAEAAFGIWGSINCCAVACCGAKPKMYFSTSPPQMNQGNRPIIVVDQSFNPNMLQNGYTQSVVSTY